MNKNTSETIKQKFIESLRLLAADYKDQIKIFPHEVNIPDEIANIFDECYSFFPFSNNEESLNSSQIMILEKLNSEIENMSDHCKKYWSMESLERGEEWMRIRQMAGNLLDSLKVEKRPPNLFWIDYIV